MKKIIRRMVLGIVLIALVCIIYYAWVSFPIMTGFAAKQLCTCTFVSGRDQKDIEANELGFFPISFVKNIIDLKDSSVTSTILGMAKKKAIYRQGIGCTLINNLTEKELRSQAFVIPGISPSNTDSIAWPKGDMVADTLNKAIDKIKLNAAVAKAFTETIPGKKQRTRAVVVLYDGQIVAEKYAPNYNKYSKMYGWSMAKSITSALIGILVKQGKLNIDAPAPVPEWSDARDKRHTITIKNLLQQTSGLKWGEIYTRASDVTNMLYKNDDMPAYTAMHPLANTPGTFFNYSSGNSNLLARIISQSVGEKEYASFPFNALFYKLGMYNTLIEQDASGTYIGSSYIMATARDYARFGLLYYNDGVWNGERILPEGWVKQTSTPPASNALKNYGYQFWINGFDKDHPSQIKYPDVPGDMFYCDGFGDQYIYIIPSKKLVIVRLGLTLDKSFDGNAFLKSIIESM
ncbi:MAG: serine hydrolase [Ginsengibacter sp.]